MPIKHKSCGVADEVCAHCPQLTIFNVCVFGEVVATPSSERRITKLLDMFGKQLDETREEAHARIKNGTLVMIYHCKNSKKRVCPWKTRCEDCKHWEQALEGTVREGLGFNAQVKYNEVVFGD